MLMISTRYEGEQYTVDLHNLIINDTYAHKLGREDLYKALVKLKCPGVEKHPLTEEQKLIRRAEIEAWQEQQQWQSEQRRAERERQQAEAEAVARHEAAIAHAEVNRQARLERQEQIARQVREREFADLRLESTRHRAWQRNVDAAARNAAAVRQQQALLADIESHFNPPQPPPEPEQIVYVSEDEGSPDLGDPDFNVKAWMKKPRLWW